MRAFLFVEDQIDILLQSKVKDEEDTFFENQKHSLKYILIFDCISKTQGLFIHIGYCYLGDCQTEIYISMHSGT